MGSSKSTTRSTSPALPQGLILVNVAPAPINHTLHSFLDTSGLVAKASLIEGWPNKDGVLVLVGVLALACFVFIWFCFRLADVIKVTFNVACCVVCPTSACIQQWVNLSISIY